MGGLSPFLQAPSYHDCVTLIVHFYREQSACEKVCAVNNPVPTVRVGQLSKFLPVAFRSIGGVNVTEDPFGLIEAFLLLNRIKQNRTGPQAF